MRTEKPVGMIALVALVAIWPLVIAFALTRVQITADAAPAYVVFFILLWLIWLAPAAVLMRRMQRELTEALERQTATSEVLRVISKSLSVLEDVFEVTLERATRVCGSQFGTMYLKDGDSFRTVAMCGAPPAYAEARMRQPIFVPGAGTALSRCAQTKKVVHIADVTLEPA